MAALDTNILVRFLVGDDVAQFAAARRLMARCVADGTRLFVPVTVVLELEWVLRACYGLDKATLLRTLSSLLSAADLSFESEQALEVALQLYRTQAADFADAVHIALAAQADASPLWTFDKAAARVSGAALLRAKS